MDMSRSFLDLILLDKLTTQARVVFDIKFWYKVIEPIWLTRLFYNLETRITFLPLIGKLKLVPDLFQRQP